MMTPLFDHHSHSIRSMDGSQPVSALVEAAISRGLHTLAITDHCDLGLLCVPDWEERLDGSRADLSAARQALGGRLTLLTGIELGQPLHDLPRAEQVLGRGGFDLVLGSLHNLRDAEDFFLLQYGCSDPLSLLECYFAELLEMARWGQFDVLAHLTYPYRYLGYENSPPITHFEEVLREIFSLLAQNGMALELNTSGFYRGNGHAMPELWELRLFRACGGEFVTLGSDAHRGEHIGGGLENGLQVLREAGFRYQTTYANRRPNAQPI